MISFTEALDLLLEENTLSEIIKINIIIEANLLNEFIDYFG